MPLPLKMLCIEQFSTLKSTQKFFNCIDKNSPVFRYSIPNINALNNSLFLCMIRYHIFISSYILHIITYNPLIIRIYFWNFRITQFIKELSYAIFIYICRVYPTSTSKAGFIYCNSSFSSYVDFLCMFRI